MYKSLLVRVKVNQMWLEKDALVLNCREENLVLNCIALLENFDVLENITDKWSWRNALSDHYYLRGTYNFLVEDDSVTTSTSFDFV